jgi:hypothetical protein
MDLVVFANALNQIVVHRINWQYLLTYNVAQSPGVAPKRLITQLCWHPCGRVLAVGMSNGDVDVISVDKSDVVPLSKLECDTPVTAISWTQQVIVEPEIFYVDRNAQYFANATDVSRFLTSLAYHSTADAAARPSRCDRSDE